MASIVPLPYVKKVLSLGKIMAEVILSGILSPEYKLVGSTLFSLNFCLANCENISVPNSVAILAEIPSLPRLIRVAGAPPPS